VKPVLTRGLPSALPQMMQAMQQMHVLEGKMQDASMQVILGVMRVMQF
jgi:hypothetical protein